MQLTPEIKAQLAEQKKQCIFCKLISGEMPAKEVFADNNVVGLLDIYPAIKGHTLFMPREHYPIMPYIPGDEFYHLFGLLPQLAKGVQTAMISTGVSIFIANGGVAGQQAPHFLGHIFPRERGDGFFNFWLNKRHESLAPEQKNMLANNLPIMMRNHFGRHPAAWHTGVGQPYAGEGKVLYEDEKVVCIIPEKEAVKGHIELYSKEEEDFTKLNSESAAHLFFVASFAATALFEGLGAHGTNIILQNGNMDDHQGRFVVHILARTAEDGMNDTLLWKPSQPSYNLDDVKEKINNKLFNITLQKPLTAEDEITAAIQNLI